LAYRLDHSDTHISLRTLRLLIDKGICKRPDCLGYYGRIAMQLSTMSERYPSDSLDSNEFFAAHLMKEEFFLEDIWRMFSLDVPHFLDTADQWSSEPLVEGQHWPVMPTWAQALKALSDRGRLDRIHLLEATLNALQGDCKPAKVAGLISFFKGMEATAEELARCQALLERLLAASSPKVIGFALDQLSALASGSELKVETFLAAAPEVFVEVKKPPAKKLIGILKQLGKSKPDQIPAIVHVLVEGILSHPEADVQEAAFRVLEAWADMLDDSVRATIRERIRTAETILARYGRTMHERYPVVDRLGTMVIPDYTPERTVDLKAKAPGDSPEVIHDDVLGDVVRVESWDTQDEYEVSVPVESPAIPLEGNQFNFIFYTDESRDMGPGMALAREFVTRYAEVLDAIRNYVAEEALPALNRDCLFGEPEVEQEPFTKGMYFCSVTVSADETMVVSAFPPQGVFEEFYVEVRLDDSLRCTAWEIICLA
jgi:hypothetical protein